MKTIREIVAEATKQLSLAGDNAPLEAEILLAYVLGKERSYLYAWPDAKITTIAHEHFQQLLARRKKGEPIAYITGTKEFWSLPLEVNQHTLIPRPETELIVEIVLRLTQFFVHPVTLADLGTGSGAIALALAQVHPAWTIYATDQSHEALLMAQKNAQTLGLKNLIFCEGNWCYALPSVQCEIIVSNPPYLAQSEWEKGGVGLSFEPISALLAGKEGLEAIREIIQTAKPYLKPHGYLIIEHGFAQGAATRKLFEQAGYDEIDSLLDLEGRERVTIGKI